MKKIISVEDGKETLLHAIFQKQKDALIIDCAFARSEKENSVRDDELPSDDLVVFAIPSERFEGDGMALINTIPKVNAEFQKLLPGVSGEKINTLSFKLLFLAEKIFKQ